MSVNMTNLLKRDMDRYILNAYQEGATLLQRTSLESHSSLTSISNESVISWVKEKVTGIFRKFVVLVNKLIARFSKNREKLEANIQAYRENPEANVTLPMSPKAIKLSIVAVIAITGTTVAIAKALKSGKGKKDIKAILDKTRENIAKAKNVFKKSKGESEEARTVKAEDAIKIAHEAKDANEKAESTIKQAAQAASSSPKADAPEDVAAAGEAARGIVELAEEAGKVGSKAVTPKDNVINDLPKVIRTAVAKMESNITTIKTISIVGKATFGGDVKDSDQLEIIKQFRDTLARTRDQAVSKIESIIDRTETCKTVEEVRKLQEQAQETVTWCKDMDLEIRVTAKKRLDRFLKKRTEQRKEKRSEPPKEKTQRTT